MELCFDLLLSEAVLASICGPRDFMTTFLFAKGLLDLPLSDFLDFPVYFWYLSSRVVDGLSEKISQT